MSLRKSQKLDMSYHHCSSHTSDLQMLISDFAPRVHRWDREGFPELGDFGGMGIGATTAKVLKQPEYKTKPHEVMKYK